MPHFLRSICFCHRLRHCWAHLSLHGLGHRLLEVSLELVSVPHWVRGQETWLVQNCCFVGRDNCGRAIGTLRETNGHWVEFEETTTLLNAASMGLGRRLWPVMYFGTDRGIHRPSPSTSAPSVHRFPRHSFTSSRKMTQACGSGKGAAACAGPWLRSGECARG